MPADRINYIKRELKNYTFYKEEIVRLEGKIADLTHRLTNIGSQGFAVVPENNDNNVTMKDTSINQRIFDLEADICDYHRRLYKLDLLLKKCDKPLYEGTSVTGKEVIERIYIKKRPDTYNNILWKLDIDYTSTGLKHRINAMIKKALRSV